MGNYEIMRTMVVGMLKSVYVVSLSYYVPPRSLVAVAVYGQFTSVELYLLVP